LKQEKRSRRQSRERREKTKTDVTRGRAGTSGEITGGGEQNSNRSRTITEETTQKKKSKQEKRTLCKGRRTISTPSMESRLEGEKGENDGADTPEEKKKKLNLLIEAR